MKARIPKHREFVIDLREDSEPRYEECWSKLDQLVKEYSVDGKSIYTSTFIEDTEEQVKALQEEYNFTYTIEWR